jgi:hypothetical protein
MTPFNVALFLLHISFFCSNKSAPRVPEADSNQQQSAAISSNQQQSAAISSNQQ